MGIFIQSRNTRPIIRVFRLSVAVIVLLVGVNNVRASQDYSQINNAIYQINEKKVTINFKNQSIRTILKEVKKQSGIGFLLNNDIIERELSNLSLNVSNVSVADALHILLLDTKYEAKISNNVIVLQLKKVKETQTNAKQINVNGVVRDNIDNKPIAGAMVTVAGTERGAISDSNGAFMFNAKVGDVIEITFIGYESQSITVKNDKNIDIIMKPDVLQVDDVVVTGFSNVKRSSYTGNATSVKRDELLKANKTNVIKALQSFDPSFRIRENNQWGSDPNALPEVNIRGNSSIGAKQVSFGADGKISEKNYLNKSNLQDNPNLPTFIMDGFEISVRKLYDFDPNRIESITILKDAAATALYGSKAANGVVIITTVAPRPGKLNVQYSLVGEITAPDLSGYNLMNAKEKLETERLAGCYDYSDDTSDYQYDIVELAKEYNAKLTNVAKGVDTDWLSKPLRTVFNHKHSIYIDGGNDNIRFGMDLQYNTGLGVMKGSKRDRMGAGFYIQYDYKGLSIRNYTSYTLTNGEESPYGSFSDYTRQLPYDRYDDDEGNMLVELRPWSTFSKNILNPLYESTLRNFDKTNEDNITNNLSINWDLKHGFLLKSQLAIQKLSSKSEQFYDPMSLRNSIPLSETVLSSGELTNNFTDGLEIDFKATLSYNIFHENHNLNTLVGVQINESSSEGLSALYRGFPSGALSSINYAREQVYKTKYSDGTKRSAGFLASLNYSYKDIYLFDASIRVDGSSSFGAENRFAPFWSSGFGINVHKYNFMKNLPFINMFKIRGSYGSVGNARFSPYESYLTYTVLSDDWYKTGYGTVLKAFGNSKLKWETTHTLDFGFEMYLFKELIYLKASYYDKKTVDVINDVTLPLSTGFSTYKDNIGEVSNRGFELDLRVAAYRNRNLSVYVTANMAQNKNKILKVSDSMKEYNRKVQEMYTRYNHYNNEVSIPLMQYQEGSSLNSVWGVKSLGINPADGRDIFVRPNGEMVNNWNAVDQIILGNTDPKGQGSIGLNVTYKQFSLYASFMYEFGSQRYNQTLIDKVENVSVYQTNVDKRVLTDRWKKPGDIAKYKSLGFGGRNSVIKTKPNSRFVQDYNMIQMTSIELSYDLPRELIRKMNIGMVRLTAGTNDLFFLSTVRQERGLSYPYARNFNFSVKISF